MKRILCIWFPHWPLQRRTVVQPELSQQPLLLYELDARRGQLVACCNQAAQQQGVRPGMRLTDAQSLVSPRAAPRSANRRWQTSAFQPLDPPADREALAQLAVWCEQFSPLVGLEESERPESLLLEVTGVANLFGGEERLARKVLRQLKQEGYEPRIAIAATVGAAWALSRFSAFADGAARFVIAPPAHPEQTLDPLPLAALRLPSQAVQLLTQLGVRQVRQLRQLPRAGVAARFGPQVARRLDQAFGELEEVIVAHRPPVLFAVQHTLEHPTAHRQTLDQLIWRLVQQLSEQLREKQRGAVQVSCRLECGASPVDIRLGLFQPTADERHLMDLVRMQLELIVVPRSVEQIRLEAPATGELQQRQQQLFAHACSHPRGLAILVDQLSSRLGRQRVVRAQLRCSANPETAYRYIPLAGVPALARPAASSASLPAAGLRPLRCHIPPLPIQVVAVAPDGPPAVLHYQGQRLTLVGVWGPERIETQWWRGQTVRRDYFRVECENGQRFWLFRRLQDQHWFLQGDFE